MGASPIGAASSPIEDKLLLLHGDGSDELGPPSPLCLQQSVVDATEINVMLEVQCLTAITAKGANYTYPLLPRNQVTSTATIMQVAPIPPYFVYDGFEGDLDAGMVYERLLRHNDVDNEMFTHLKDFLRACLSSHNTADAKPYAAATVFATTPVIQARRWAKQKFCACFPSLVPSTPPPPSSLQLLPILRP